MVLVFIFKQRFFLKRVKRERIRGIAEYYNVCCTGFKVGQSVWPLSIFFPLK